MALINRFEVINYLDKIGDTGMWQPNFRLMHFNLQGMSTLIRMDNGEGKTSMASALYLLLTRHRTLAAEIKQKMSPAGVSSWSHIRVEVIVNDESQPLFVGTGGGVSGETWVFGVCGHREEGLKFYFYPGTLEDLPAAYDYGNQVKVLSNKEFYDNQKSLEKVRWEPSVEDYNAALASIFPPRAFQLGLELHLRGGAENDDIFPVKGKDPASELFYEHIAPHLLASDIPAEETGEEGEYFFEETIINSAQLYGRATIQTEEKRKSVEKFTQTVQESSHLRRAAKEAREKGYAAKEARKGTDVGLILLNQIVQEQAIPGIPKNLMPEGLLGKLVEGIVWHATERELCLQDSALVLLTGQQVRVLNQDALRSGIRSFTKEKNRLVLSPANALALETQARGKVYPFDSVFQFLERSGLGFSEKLTLDEVRSLVTEAGNWWRENCDTNPARTEVKRTQKLILLTEDKISDLSSEVERLGREESELKQKLSSFEQGKVAWQALANSGLFTDAELQSPVDLGEASKVVAATARENLSQHRIRKSVLEPLSSSYEEFLVLYPKTQPEQALQTEQQRRLNIQKNEDSSREKLNQTRKRVETCDKSVNQTQRELETLTETENKFALCQQGNSVFIDIFADEDPRNLDVTVQEELRQTEEDIVRFTAQKEHLLPQVKLIEDFRAKYPSETCNDLIFETKENQSYLQREIDALTEKKKEAKTRLEELRQHKISPTPIARKALDLLQSPKKLYEVVYGFGLSPDRLAQVLSHFSAVLFSPVFDSPGNAEKAIFLLEEAKLPVPVFLESELHKYSENQKIACEGNLYYSHQAGSKTPTVSTIIAPERIQQLIDETIQELLLLEERFGLLSGEKSPIDEQLDWFTEVKRALDRKVLESFQKKEAELHALNIDLPRQKKRASSAALEAIRARREYLSLGGDDKILSLSEAMDNCRERLDASHSNLRKSTRDLEIAEEEESSARKSLRDFEQNWPHLETVIKSAVQFVQEGGPDFMSFAASAETSLKEQQDLAENRLPFNFVVAQQFVDSRGNLKDMVKTLEQIEINKLHYSQKKTELEKEKVQKGKSYQRAWDKMYRIDEGVASLLSLWKDFHSTIRLLTKGVTIQSLANLRKLVSEKAPRLQPFFTAIDRISVDANKETGSAEHIRQSFEMITETLNDIGRKIEDVRRKQREADSANNLFQEECQRYLKNTDGLSVNEREVISTADDNYDEVLDLFSKLDLICSKEKARLEELERGLEAITEKAHERLVSLLDSAEDNLRLLNKVAKRTTDGTIIIKNSMIGADGLKDLIRKLLAEVETELRYREERGKSSFSEHDLRADPEWKKNLRSKIADWFYRGVFPTAKVYIKHTSVRGGKETPFRKEGISSGERLAIALVIIGKLQEFIQEREVYWQIKNSTRRRKRGKTQGLLLLDGIFSKLSKKEMIKVAMEAYRGLKGSFQLIGLNHYEIENDKEVFPNYFDARKVTTTTGGFLVLNDKYRPIPPQEIGRREGELILSRATITPLSSESAIR